MALPHALERFLLRRLRCRNAADVAQESVVRWLQKFQADTARWPDIYRWCLRTARRIVIDEWRHARIERVAPEAVVEELPSGHVVASDDAQRLLAEVVDEMRPSLPPADRGTLECLLIGLDDNEEIARVRGRRLRSVQASRARLRARGEQMRNLCQALHCRSLMGVRPTSRAECRPSRTQPGEPTC